MVSTEELHTFKMVQKTIVAYLDFTYIRW